MRTRKERFAAVSSQGHNGFGVRKRMIESERIGGVQFGLKIDQQIAPTRVFEHGLGIQPASQWHATRQPGADAVGRITDDAQACAALMGDPGRELINRAGLCMTHRALTQPDGFGNDRSRRLREFCRQGICNTSGQGGLGGQVGLRGRGAGRSSRCRRASRRNQLRKRFRQCHRPLLGNKAGDVMKNRDPLRGRQDQLRVQRH